MRILHCIASVNPTGGGPIEALSLRIAALVKRGHSSEVACLDAPAASWLVNFATPVHALGPRRTAIGYSGSWTPWIRDNYRRFDAIVINGLWQFNAFGTWRALRDTATPYVVYTHGMLDPWFKQTYPLKHLKKWLYWPWADYRVLRDAAAVLFTSEEERLLARQSFWLYRCNEKVVNYGTAGPTGDAVAQKAAFAATFPELAGKKQFLFLGRVHVKKGPDLLFHAFANLLKIAAHPELQEWRLVMAGPNNHAYGREMQALAQALGIADRVIWTGMLQGDVKWGAFYNADAFVLPSHQENFGIAVAEALACGVPVLISNKVNIWREIEADGAGFVNDDTVGGTEALLRRWIQTPLSAKQQMRQQALETFQQRYHIEKAAESFLEVVESVVAARKPDSRR